MKKRILIILCAILIVAIPASSQVTMGSLKAPEKFSLLELISNNQRGLRLPQLTTQERTALEQSADFQNQKGGLAKGLVIFNTDTNCMETWNGSKWISLCAAMPNPEDITDNLLPAGVTPYVGAFWKANQTGERLIRITRPTAAPVNTMDGPWSATVIAGADWIVLDTQMTTDPNVGWRTDVTPNEANVHSYESNSNFDQLHPVNSTLTSVSGTVSEASPQIYFRIGLKSALPSASTPPRYGVVLLTYTNRNAVSKLRIWIRQGEAADYVMRKTDLITGATGYTGERKLARKILPCNTSWSQFNTAVTYNNGLTTAYPSQAGAYFQWVNTTYRRYAYPPTGTATPWDSNYPGYPINSFWTDATFNYSATYETCPAGFHRPSDGVTDQNVPMISASEVTPTYNSVINSELRQSLWLNPPQNTFASGAAGNSIWGYYADGFFDRRKISDSPNGVALSAVSTGDNNIAYVGRLFFNQSSDSYASVFFPAMGTRNYSTGALEGAGNSAYYWSSSTAGAANDGAWALYFTPVTPNGTGGVSDSFVTVSMNVRAWGMPVRGFQ